MERYFYIIKGGMYYRTGACGYTEYKTEAGVYPGKEAFEHKEHCSELGLEEIDIEEHNQLLLRKIEDITSRLIRI